MSDSTRPERLLVDRLLLCQGALAMMEKNLTLSLTLAQEAANVLVTEGDRDRDLNAAYEEYIKSEYPQ